MKFHVRSLLFGLIPIKRRGWHSLLGMPEPLFTWTMRFIWTEAPTLRGQQEAIAEIQRTTVRRITEAIDGGSVVDAVYWMDILQDQLDSLRLSHWGDWQRLIDRGQQAIEAARRGGLGRAKSFYRQQAIAEATRLWSEVPFLPAIEVARRIRQRWLRAEKTDIPAERTLRRVIADLAPRRQTPP